MTPTLIDPFTLYLAANGDDARSGLAPDEAVGTLMRAQTLLEERFGRGAERLDRDVLIHVAPGRYVGQHVTWSFTHPDHIVKIAGYASAADSSKPHFVGCADPSCPATRPWFLLDAATGQASNVHLVNLKVSRYFRPLVFQGGSDMDSQWNGANVVHRMAFYNIGTRYRSDITPEVWSPGIIILKNSRSNKIWQNRIEDSSNRMRHANAWFHTVYASHGASDNSVRFNEIIDTSGDFHVRDRSDRNVFGDNRVERSFIYALVTDWNAPGESESCATEISGNVWKADWSGQRNRHAFRRVTAAPDDRCGSNGLADRVVRVPNRHRPAGR